MEKLALAPSHSANGDESNPVTICLFFRAKRRKKLTVSGLRADNTLERADGEIIN
jgi:hypothetical protein